MPRAHECARAASSILGSRCIARPLVVGEIHLASAQIYRADHSSPTSIQDVGVDHRRGYVGVTQEFLHRTNVVTAFEQMRRERVTQRVSGDSLANAGSERSAPHSALNAGLMNVMPANLPGPRIDRQLSRWKQVLPTNLLRRMRKLTRERIGKEHLAVSTRDIFFMQRDDGCDLLLKRFDVAPRQRHNPILLPLTIANDDL